MKTKEKVLPPPIGLEPDEKEKGSEEEGEEQTDGGKKQRDKGLGDAEEPPVDGEEVDEASGSEGKPGDPGPSEFEGKGGPIGGGEVEETDDSGISINAKSKAERVKVTNSDKKAESKGGGDTEFIFDELTFGTGYATVRGNKVTGRQASDAVSRRRRSAAIKQYVQQLPPEFRQQVADYYEALAQ